MAKVYWLPPEKKEHSCREEIHTLEKGWFVEKGQHFSPGTVLECSCDLLWRLTEDWTGQPENLKVRLNSFFQSNRTYKWLIWKKT